MVTKITITTSENEEFYFTNANAIESILNFVKSNGIKCTKTNKNNVLFKRYFAFLGDKSRLVGTSKQKLHTSLKKIIYSQIKDFKGYILDETKEPSLTNLTNEGVRMFIDSAVDYFNKLEE